MDESKIPVLVACGQVVDRSVDGSGSTPVELMANACRLAGSDSGSGRLLTSVETIAASGLTVDADQAKTPFSGAYSNVPKTVANLLGIKAQRHYYAAMGGNTPQMLVNHFAEQIAEGRAETVLLTGGEALKTMLKRFDHWSKLLWPKGVWKDKPGGKPISIGDQRPSNSDHEMLYGLDLPAHVYPLFENALCAHYQRTQEEHMLAVGSMFARLSEVAASNPFAWFRKSHTAEDLITPSTENRMIAYPYTKLLNSVITVNQAAAVIMTSVARARELGIDSDNWVYLHGCADAHDHWNISDRVNYHSSPALARTGQTALAMAGKSIEEMDCFDLYSCFPSAVQIACDELGIAHDDPRGLSLTGGLPYFGGAGNNYAMHAIAEMMQTLRQQPGKFGLVNANGWFLTKHSVGVYSTSALKNDWHREPMEVHQQDILRTKGPRFEEKPKGDATIETFTVIHNRDQTPSKGIVIGRLESGDRFIAESCAKELAQVMKSNPITFKGAVHQKKNTNHFVLD